MPPRAAGLRLSTGHLRGGLRMAPTAARSTVERHQNVANEVALSSPVAAPHPSHVGVPTRVLGVFLALHGFAHLVGTSASFDRAADGDSAQYLAGAWTLSDPALLRLAGLVWALVAAAFLYAGAVAWLRRPEWPRVLAVVSVVSLALCVIALWASVVGVVIDVALLAVAARAWAFARR